MNDPFDFFDGGSSEMEASMLSGLVREENLFGGLTLPSKEEKLDFLDFTFGDAIMSDVVDQAPTLESELFKDLSIDFLTDTNTFSDFDKFAPMDFGADVIDTSKQTEQSTAAAAAVPSDKSSKNFDFNFKDENDTDLFIADDMFWDSLLHVDTNINDLLNAPLDEPSLKKEFPSIPETSDWLLEDILPEVDLVKNVDAPVKPKAVVSKTSSFQPVESTPPTTTPNTVGSGTASSAISKPPRRILLCTQKPSKSVQNVIKTYNRAGQVVKKEIATANQKMVVYPTNVVKNVRPIKIITNKVAKVGSKPTPKVIDIPRPDTPESEEDYLPPLKKVCKRNSLALKKISYNGRYLNDLLDDDFCGDSFRCFPPAEVTGQVQQNVSYVNNSFMMSPAASVKSENVKSSPECSPKNSIDMHAMTMEMMLNKNAASIDHDYVLSCRTQLARNVAFCIDHLGIQTPSASEPPTDSDEEDCNRLEHVDIKLEPEEDDFVKSSMDNLRYTIISQGNMGRMMGKNIHMEFEASKGGRKKTKKRKLTPQVFQQPNQMSRIKMPHSAISDMKGSKQALISVGFYHGTAKRGGVNGRTANGKPKGSGSRTFTPTERVLHNSNEQARRIEMRRSFEYLRGLIPNLLTKQKAPKVVILQEAKMYCDELFCKDLKMQAQVESLKKAQDQLRNRLSNLRKTIAASRS